MCVPGEKVCDLRALCHVESLGIHPIVQSWWRGAGKHLGCLALVNGRVEDPMMMMKKMKMSPHTEVGAV